MIMSKKPWRPSDYTIERALKDMLVREESIYHAGDIQVGRNYVMRDHGDYVEINIDADTPKGHVSYDLFFDENDRLVDWKKHR